MSWITGLLGIISSSVVWIVATILLVIICGVIFYFMYQWRIYNKTIYIFENLAGKGYILTGLDKARLIKFGKTGEEVLYLRKRKLYRTAYGRKMGTNSYWFAVGQDGYWYNFILGDLDAKREMLDIEPIDRDVRMMYVAMSNNINSRFDKKTFMEQYGTIIFSSIILLIFVIGCYFMLSKIGGIAETLNKGLEESVKLQASNGEIAARIDSMLSGSGLKTVVT